MAKFDSSTPFILIARIQVKPGKVEEYLELATKTDAAVKASEQGMLHHTFDQDPDNPLCFTWSEVYQNDGAFHIHLANPSVGEYLQGHTELGDSFTIEVYGTIGKECKEAMLATGIPLKFFESKCGYSRLKN